MSTPIGSMVLVGWIPVCTVFFLLFRPVRALTLAYLIGWLLLPMTKIDIHGFWDVDKVLATNAGVLLGTMLFCSGQFRGYRINLADIILVVFAVGTCAASLSNGLGAYDGVSSIAKHLFRYALPFWFGRAFIKDRRDLLDAARLIVWGAAGYALLAIWEWRMSPQIHKTLYGFFQHSFGQHARWGFYRPVVCFPHALALGTFFAWTSLVGYSLWRTGRLRPVMGFPAAGPVVLLLIGLLASMSFGPWGLFGLGLVLLICRSRGRWRRLVWLPAVCALLWMFGRYTGLTDGKWMSGAVAAVAPDRAHSLQGRIDSETLLIDRAKERPILGWSTWDRNRVLDDRGRKLAITDGLWVILLGSFGLVGLSSFYLWWYCPLLLSRRAGPELEHEPVIMPLLITVSLQAINFLFNGFLSPVLTLLNGGMITSMNRTRNAAAMEHVR